MQNARREKEELKLLLETMIRGWFNVTGDGVLSNWMNQLLYSIYSFLYVVILYIQPQMSSIVTYATHVAGPNVR
jgi:hypothetical protein